MKPADQKAPDLPLRSIEDGARTETNLRGLYSVNSRLSTDLSKIAFRCDSQPHQQGKEYSRFQRAFDCVMATTVLVLTAPLIVMIGLIIRLDSRGPAIFCQWRVGKDGKLFLFRKFRTLHVDAKERFPHLYAYQYSPEEIKELQFKLPDDPRVTRVGRWLRDSTLDELPNLWNVLTGDMALVGPRPEIPEMQPYYDKEGMQKFSVKPGMTGLAQISGRGRLKFLETLRYDLEYVRQRSFWFDLKILLMTMYKVIVRDGAF